MTTCSPSPPGPMADPQPLRAGVERLLRHLGAPRVDAVQALFDRWPDLVGPGPAAHTRPVSVARGELVIAVDDTTWASHLQWSGAELVIRINEVLGEAEITDLRVVVRPVGQP